MIFLFIKYLLIALRKALIAGIVFPLKMLILMVIGYF